MNSDATGGKGVDLSHVVLKLEDADFSRIEGDCWTHFSFRILKWPDDTETYSDEILLSVGHLEVLRLNWAVANEQEKSLLDIFYSDWSQTIDCYEAIFDKKDHLRKPFRDESSFGLFEDLTTDLHILDRITIDEHFKGQGITGEASRIYLERFASGYDAYYVKAFPLQFEGNETHPQDDYPRKFNGTFRACQEKLCKYYQELGFRRIGKTPHFFGSVEDYYYRRQRILSEK